MAVKMKAAIFFIFIFFSCFSLVKTTCAPCSCRGSVMVCNDLTFLSNIPCIRLTDRIKIKYILARNTALSSFDRADCFYSKLSYVDLRGSPCPFGTHSGYAADQVITNCTVCLQNKRIDISIIC